MQTLVSWCKRPVCALTTLHVFVLCHVKEKTDCGEMYIPLCCTDYHVSLPFCDPNRWVELMIYWWRPACTTKRLPLLTPTRTVSSDWNLGMNWSPRRISDWLRGRKRHNTFMLHSAGISAIAQIQGGRMLLSERRDAAEAGGDPSLIGAWSDRLNKRGGMRSDLVLLRRGDSEDGGEVGWFYPDKLREDAIYLCAAGWCFRVAERLADWN